MQNGLTFITPNLLSNSRSQFVSILACSRRFTGDHVHPVYSTMVMTRSSKRKPEEAASNVAKRQTTAKPKTTKSRKADNPKEKEEVIKPKENTAKSSTANANGPSHYLFKSEPESRIQNGHEMKYSIDDLAAEPDQTAYWDGVRNAEARNTMKTMKKGDLGFFYHSNTKKSRPGIIGIVEVVKEAYPDHTAFDKNDPHFDPKSSKESPRWYMVDVRLVEKFPRCITLDEIKANQQLSQMQLVKRGRISVQRVNSDEWNVILKVAKESPHPKN